MLTLATKQLLRIRDFILTFNQFGQMRNTVKALVSDHIENSKKLS